MKRGQDNEIVCFDDFATNEDGSIWAHICKSCVKKYGISPAVLDDGCCCGTCSVQGCGNEADFYVDFPDESGNPEENESVWRVELDTLKERIRVGGV